MELRERWVRLDVGEVRVLSAGDPAAPAVVFLHGWPESADSWVPMLELASERFHAVAPDLPGVGGSVAATTDGTKDALAGAVHDLIGELGLRDVVLVGHDVGGMATYAYLRRFPGLRAAVIMDVVVPGLDPWERVLRNPKIWHFAWHAVPDLPERLVQGNQRAYFDHFYDTLTVDGSSIGEHARDTYAAAYATDHALRSGFDWYRAFPRDAEANAAHDAPIETPLLYLRGAASTGRTTASGIGTYVEGLRGAGVQRVSSALVPGALHFLPEEAPHDTWRAVERFLHDADPFGGRKPTSHERMTGLPWDASYQDGPAPWDIGGPQPAIVRVAAAGGFSGTVLDAGCGTGDNTLHVAALGHPVLGVDVAETGLALARERAAAQGVEAEFAVGDGLDLGRLGRTFDTVLDCGLFHTFDADEWPDYVASLATVTEPGATLYVLCFGDEGPDIGPHPVSQENLRSVFTPDAGWEVVAIVAERVRTRFHDEHGAPAWLATLRRR